MASPTLHIKDSYYFEIPKFLWRCDYKSKSEFPAVWIKNDPQFQDWQAARILKDLPAFAKEVGLEVPSGDLLDSYKHWRQSGDNFGKPFVAYLEQGLKWIGDKANEAKANEAKANEAKANEARADQAKDTQLQEKWFQFQSRIGDREAVEEFRREPSMTWSPEKLAGYNRELSGKVLIPQPFGELRNFYEKESGFCISRFMIVELLVLLGLVLVFSRVAKKVATGDAPRGRLWNLFEGFLVLIRDEIARKAIHDHHDHDHHDHDHGHEHGHVGHHGEAGVADNVAAHKSAHPVHGDPHAHESAVGLRPHAADRYVPLLWTIFFFILCCNLMGMLPWLGAPTGSFSVTLALAGVAIVSSIAFGSMQFGFVGFWLNQVPAMQLPLILAIVLKPMIFCIEVLGFFIKHGVLAIRLLANMVAGHLVLLAIMTLAFSAEGAASSAWPIMAVISVLASTAFSILELFVAFLQAYVFTFLTALFIGAATSRH